ncbi:MAG: Holliday junction branch migration DNA helicase RuvB [Planctomycetes bacterium]|nr:Holliday junction branch migration DNA helicase RuvB [Planctomycetota bacterium]
MVLRDPEHASPFHEPAAVDSAYEVTLRPARLVDFVGQDRIRQNLRIFIQASLERGEPLDHLLFSGLPGLGKTTLATIVANELGARLHTTSGPALDKAFDIVGPLTKLERGDVLFIDEIHRLARPIEEFLYTAMEDFKIDLVIDKGPGARSVRIDLKPFTLIGATTREGLLTAPLRSRFGVLERLEPYQVAELVEIVARSARLFGVAIDPDAATLLAERSRGTPRVVNRFLRRLRDIAQVRSSNRIDAALALEGLEMLGVDHLGLEALDREILRVLHRTGLPAGLKTIAAAVGEEERTIEDVYEPHLLRSGFVAKTPRGRMLTDSGRQALGLPPAAPFETPGGELFP